MLLSDVFPTSKSYSGLVKVLLTLLSEGGRYSNSADLQVQYWSIAVHWLMDVRQALVHFSPLNGGKSIPCCEEVNLFVPFQGLGTHFNTFECFWLMVQHLT